jgi:hypothetical protein
MLQSTEQFSDKTGRKMNSLRTSCIDVGAHCSAESVRSYKLKLGGTKQEPNGWVMSEWQELAAPGRHNLSMVLLRLPGRVQVFKKPCPTVSTTGLSSRMKPNWCPRSIRLVFAGSFTRTLSAQLPTSSRGSSRLRPGQLFRDIQLLCQNTDYEQLTSGSRAIHILFWATHTLEWCMKKDHLLDWSLTVVSLRWMDLCLFGKRNNKDSMTATRGSKESLYSAPTIMTFMCGTSNYFHIVLLVQSLSNTDVKQFHWPLTAYILPLNLRR